MADLPERLRAAADAHLPDRERMLARVERAIAASEAESAPSSGPWREDRAAPWTRVGAVAAAVAGAIGLGSLAVGAVCDGGADHPAATSQAPGSPRDGSLPATASATGAPPAPSSPGRAEGGASDRKAASGTSTAGPGHRPGADAGPRATAGGAAPGAGTGTAAPPATPTGPVRVTAGLDPHSNPYWTESDVHVTTTARLASLTVEVRISAGSGAVTSNSSFTSAPGVPAAEVSTLSDGSLLYRWKLGAGQVLAPGTYTFGAQFDHDRASRDTTADRWSATAAGAGPAADPYRFSGHF